MLLHMDKSLNMTNESLALAFCQKHRDFLQVLFYFYKSMEISLGNEILHPYNDGEFIIQTKTDLQKKEIFRQLSEIIQMRELFHSYLNSNAQNKYKYYKWMEHLYHLLLCIHSKL